MTTACTNNSPVFDRDWQNLKPLLWEWSPALLAMEKSRARLISPGGKPIDFLNCQTFFSIHARPSASVKVAA
jgi:hypothetical protein